MPKYIELIDKYLIEQSKDTDYNPPSYIWVDNTGEIVRCAECKHSDTFSPHCTDATFPLKCLSIRYGGVYPNWFCEHGEKRDER